MFRRTLRNYAVGCLTAFLPSTSSGVGSATGSYVSGSAVARGGAAAAAASLLQNLIRDETIVVRFVSPSSPMSPQIDD